MSRSVVDTTWLLADGCPRLAPFRVGYVAIMDEFDGADGREARMEAEPGYKSQSRADQVLDVYLSRASTGGVQRRWKLELYVGVYLADAMRSKLPRWKLFRREHGPDVNGVPRCHRAESHSPSD